MAETEISMVKITDDAKQNFQQLMNNYLAALSSMQPSEWSKDAREWCIKNKIITNAEDMQWKRFATREELIALLYKFEDLLDNQEIDNSPSLTS